MKKIFVISRASVNSSETSLDEVICFTDSYDAASLMLNNTPGEKWPAVNDQESHTQYDIQECEAKSVDEFIAVEGDLIWKR